MSSEHASKVQDKSAKTKVSDFFLNAPGSIRKTMVENNESFLDILIKKSKAKVENKHEDGENKQENVENKQAQKDIINEQQNTQIKSEDKKQPLNEQPLQTDHNIQQIQMHDVNNINNDSQNNVGEDNHNVDLTQSKKRDQIMNFFSSQTAAAVSQQAGNSYDQLITSLRKKQEENKQQSQSQKEQTNTDPPKVAELSQKELEIKEQTKSSQDQKQKFKQDTQNVVQDIKKEEFDDKNKKQNVQKKEYDVQKKEQEQSKNQLEQQKNVQDKQVSEQAQQKKELDLKNNLQTPSNKRIEEPVSIQDQQQLQPKQNERKVDQLAQFFTSSTTAINSKASEQFSNFKTILQDKSRQKKELQQPELYSEEREKRQERSQSFENSKIISKIIPHNSHYDEEMEKERKRLSERGQNDSFYSNYSKSGFNHQGQQEDEIKQEQNKKVKLTNEHYKKNKPLQNSPPPPRLSQNNNKFILKRKNSAGQKLSQNQSQQSHQNPNHIYVRQFVEKEIDKEEKLRDAARKKRELELQLLQVNQELIHLRKDLTNEERSPPRNQITVKKGKLIPPIKEQNQVKAMIQISDDKKALEDAMSLVKRMQQERKLKEQHQAQKLHENSDRFKCQILAMKEQDEQHAYQKEFQKKNIVLTRMQQYELKKIEGQKLQNASRQFVKDLVSQGPRDGKISEIYKQKVHEIENDLDINLSQVRISKLQTPLLDQKKQNLQNARNISDYHGTNGNENNNDNDNEYDNDNENDDINDRQGEEYNNLEEESKEYEYNQRQQKRDSSQKGYMPAVENKKKNYGSIFTKRVVNYDMQIKQQDRLLSEEKKILYEKRINYAKGVKQKYTPKNIVDNYNFYQDAIYLKQKMKITDQINADYHHSDYRQDQREPLRASLPSEEYKKYSKEPTNYIEANRAWKVHNKIILNHDYPQSEQIKKLKY